MKGDNLNPNPNWPCGERLCDFFQIIGGDGDEGGTQEVEGDDEVGLVALTGDGTFETGELTTDDTDMIAKAERG